MIRRSDAPLDRSDGSSSAGPGVRDPLETLAEEYAERRRRGERPTVDEYCARNPGLADEIRDLFPTLDLLEDVASASGPRAPFEVEPPRELGDFVLLREIGRGGMGVVYEAEQRALGRRVALKILPPRAVSDPRFAERFRLEAQAAAGLDHPGIVPVHGVGESDGLHYYAMQYIDGVGLDAVIEELRRRRCGEPAREDPEGERVAEIVDRWLAPRSGSESSMDSGSDTGLVPIAAVDRGNATHRAIARVGLRIAEALAAAHARGILHRDIKPSNILFDAKGRTWIADFGLCKLEGVGDLTQSGALVGTLRYMAPERFEGRSGVQADVYAIGLILWELLASRSAFGEGDRAELVGRITREGVPRLRDRDAAVPTDLELVIRRACERDVVARYPTADAFAQDLRAFLEGRPVAARNPSLTYLARMYIRRHRALAATIAIFLLLAVVGGTAAIHRLRSSRELAERNAATARHRESIAHLSAAAASIGEGDSTAARARLERIPPEHREWEWHHFRSRTDDSIRSYPPDRIAAWGVAYSADGERIHAASGNRVRTFSTRDGSLLHDILAHPQVITSIDVDDAAGTVVTAHMLGRVEVRDLASGALVREIQPENRVNCEQVRFGPDCVAIASRDLRIVIRPREGGPPRHVLEHTHIVWAFEFAPDGRTLVSTCGDGTVRRWDVGTGELLWTARNDGGRSEALAFSPDGSRVAIGALDTTLAVYDVESGEELLSIAGDHTTGLAYLDADRILVASGHSEDGSWLRIRDARTGRSLHRLRGHSRSIASLALRPDRLRAVTVSWDGSIREWDLSFESDPDVLSGPLDDVYLPEWSPDGRWIAAASRDGTVRVWDARTGRIRRTLLGISGPVWRALFLDDRTLLGAGSGELVVWDLRDGSVRSRARFPAHMEQWADVLPDRTGALLLDRSGRLHRFALPSLAASEPIALHDSSVVVMRIGPKGRRIAAALPDHRIRVWDLGTLELEQEWTAHAELVRDLVFHPDGERLVSVSLDGSVRLRDLGTGEAIATLTEGDSSLWLHTEGLTSAAFSPDGSRLAVGSRDGSVRLWDVDSRLEVARLRGHSGWVMGVTWSQDGRTLASSSTDRTVRVWRTGPREEGREALVEVDRAAEAFVGGELDRGATLHDLARRIADDADLDDEAREARLGHVHARLGTSRALLDRAWELLTSPSADRDSRELAAGLVRGQRARYGRDQHQSLVNGILELHEADIFAAERHIRGATQQPALRVRNEAAALGLLLPFLERTGDDEGARETRTRYEDALRRMEPEERRSLEEIVRRLGALVPPIVEP